MSTMLGKTGVALYLILVLTVGVGLAQVTLCGHDYFDIQTLRSQNNWYGSVNPEQCIDGLLSHDKTCTLHFAICQPLPANVCGDGTNTGICQSVVNSTGSFNYDIGKIDFLVHELNGSAGFQFIYQNGTSVDNCNSTRTLLFFNCDKTAQWDAKNTNITKYLDSNIQLGCDFITSINYSGACIPQKPIDPDLCNLDTFNLQTLTDKRGWVATVPKDKCINGTSEPSCDLMFSFCKHLPNTGQCFDSVFCQPGENPFSFGGYNSHLRISKNADDLGFTITNYNGTSTAHCPNGYFSTLIFICDSKAHWEQLHDYNITKFIRAEPSFNDCEYIIRFNYSGACPEITSGPVVTGTQSSNTVGVVLISLFVGVALLYLIIGITVQAIRGKRGMELVPNYEFWRNFFLLVMEGCRFTLNIVTCFQLQQKGILNRHSKMDYESL